MLRSALSGRLCCAGHMLCLVWVYPGWCACADVNTAAMQFSGALSMWPSLGACLPGVVPAGVHTIALSSSYVLAANDQEAAVMVKFLGVQAPTAAQVYRSDILPKLHTLPQAVRDRAMLLMLRQLPDLQQQDSSFLQLLAQTPFLPSGKGVLHVPSELYDPRSPELVALLDPGACFPASAFCGDASDAAQDDQQGPNSSSSSNSFSSLAALQQLGLRSSAQLDTLVLAARYVAQVSADGDMDMAVARGKVSSGFLHLLCHCPCFPSLLRRYPALRHHRSQHVPLLLA